MKYSEKLILLFVTFTAFGFFWINLRQQPIKVAFKNNPFSITPTQKVKPAKPVSKYISPTPLPLLQAKENLKIRMESENIVVFVPDGATYKTDFEWEMHIYPTQNLIIEMCWGCQPISLFGICGEGYGMGGEGICKSEKITLGNLEMVQHYFTDDRKFAFIAGPYGKNNDTLKSTFIGIKTSNNQYPTDSEKQILNKIISSITVGK